MPKGKKGLVKRGQEAGEKEKLDEVEKEFYELQLKDIHQRIARYTARNAELQEEIDDNKKVTQKLDEDKADIISFMKKTLKAKLHDIEELKAKIITEQKERELAKQIFIETIKRMEIEFKEVHERLTSEIKLLMGKLNALEEFRLQRDELLKKYEYQEKLMVRREEEHRKKLEEVERKFRIAKDKLKKDMESKLLRISLKFQKVTQKRIAPTTQRVIRENVAVNNELDALKESWEKLNESQSLLTTKQSAQKTEIQSLKEYTYDLIKNIEINGSIFTKIKNEHEKLQTKYKEVCKHEIHARSIEEEFISTDNELNDWKEKLQKAEQMIHFYKTSKALMNREMKESLKDAEKYQIIITKANQLILQCHQETKSLDKSPRIGEQLLRTIVLSQFYKFKDTFEEEDIEEITLKTVEEADEEETVSLLGETTVKSVEDLSEQIEEYEPHGAEEATDEELLQALEMEEQSHTSYCRDTLINNLQQILEISSLEDQIKSADTIIDITGSYFFTKTKPSEQSPEESSSSSCT